MIGRIKDLRCSPAWLATAAVSLGIAAAVLSYPMAFGLTARGTLGPLTHDKGYAWTADLPAGVPSPRGRAYLLPEVPRLYEGRIPLGPALDDDKKIQRGGWGRYEVSGRVVVSASDGGSPAGREYTVETGAVQIPEDGLLAMWGAALLLGILAVRQGFGAAWRARLGRFPGGAVAMAGGAAWIAWALVAPAAAAGPLFCGLAAPAAWAAGLATLAGRRGKISLAALAAFALLPAAASYAHYAIGGASHDSFLIAGAIPWSDAGVHFFQAAQISISGATETAFNGRFLYPLFLSGLLPLTAWNLQLAHSLVTGLCLLGVALLCRVTLPLSGRAGAALLALGSWLFLRADVAGVAMTEGLGFAAGVIGLAAIVVAWPKRSWPLFFIGLFVLSLGMAARPGSVLVLPMIGLAAAWREYSAGGQRHLARGLAVLSCSALVAVAPFALNIAAGKIVSASGTVPFNNFAFSFHGLLTDRRWSDSAEESKSPDVAMRRSLELLRAEPWRLARGSARAVEFTWRKAFLFHFGDERRLARTMLLLALAGLVAVRVLPGWRGQRTWVWLAAAGLLLSLPFAPPWDAGVRAYATTVPFQCILAGAGLALALEVLRRLGNWQPSGNGMPLSSDAMVYAACGLLALLAVAWPIVRALSLSRVPPVADTHAWPPDCRPGSSRLVVDADAYRRSLAAFLAGQGDIGSDYLRIREGAIVGVDWHRLASIAVRATVPPHSPEFFKSDWVWIDRSILDASGPREETLFPASQKRDPR